MANPGVKGGLAGPARRSRGFSGRPRARLLDGKASSAHYVHESDRVLLDDTVKPAIERRCDAIGLPSLVDVGP